MRAVMNHDLAVHRNHKVIWIILHEVLTGPLLKV